MFKKIDFLLITIIVSVTTLLWHGVLGQIIEGEGYYYFSPTNSFILPNGRVTDLLHNFDNFPRFFTYLLENIYKGDPQGYVTTQFLIIILLFISIYFFIKSITQKRLLALIATLYMAANYTGDFQFFARGHFQWFTQRVPEFFPILISVFFLYKYLLNQKLKNYFFSLVFFTLAIFMTHYTTLFLPLYPALMLSFCFFPRKTKKQSIKLILLSIPFVVTNYLIVSNSSLSLETIKPHQTLLESILLASRDIFDKISFQLTVVTIPFSVTKFISQIMKENPQQIIPKLIIPTYMLCTFIGYFLYKRRFLYFNLVVACFLALLSVLFLNVYLGRIIVFNEVEQGRYYFIPGFYVGIIFASFLYEVLIKPRKMFGYIILGVLLACWIIPNTNFAWRKIHDSQRFYTGGRLLFQKLDKVKNEIPANSILMLPNPLMPLGEDFLKKYYSGQNTKFLFIDSKWKSKIPEGFDLNKLYVFDFNEEYDRGGNARLQFISVVDKSQDYRKLFLAK